MARPIGLMAAMQEEIEQLLPSIQSPEKVVEGGRTYVKGNLFGKPVVAVFSRWGKVAATITATHLITRFGVDEILFTGVAGSIQPHVRIGDVVLGKAFFQHDLDPRPFFPRFEIPLLGVSAVESPLLPRNQVHAAIHQFLTEDWHTSISPALAQQFTLQSPQIHLGDIASGDQFISDPAYRDDLVQALPSVLCVEMEGAAVAQVCAAYKVPFNVVRIISDVADQAAEIDFPAFVSQVASPYSLGIVRRYLAVRG